MHVLALIHHVEAYLDCIGSKFDCPCTVLYYLLADRSYDHGRCGVRDERLHSAFDMVMLFNKGLSNPGCLATGWLLCYCDRLVLCFGVFLDRDGVYTGFIECVMQFLAVVHQHAINWVPESFSAHNVKSIAIVIGVIIIPPYHGIPDMYLQVSGVKIGARSVCDMSHCAESIVAIDVHAVGLRLLFRCWGGCESERWCGCWGRRCCKCWGKRRCNSRGKRLGW